MGNGSVLVELSIRDFAIIESLRVPFDPGLNVLTGETGAGKSIIIDALGAVLGERIGPDAVRTGAKAAHVEAIFELADPPIPEDVVSFADEHGIDLTEGTLILSREITASGRTTARINGRATTAGALNRIGALLVDVHGQSDHLSLLRQIEHLDMLDRFADTISDRAAVGELVRELRGVRQTIAELVSGARERERRIDLLSFQVAEITDASLEPGEDERLVIERDVLTNAERLAEEAARAYISLTGNDADDVTGVSAIDVLRRAAIDLDAIAAVDASMEGTAERLREVTFLIEDVIAEVRDYRDRIDADPSRLEAIEERLDLIKRLQRKYGASVAEVIAYGEAVAAELEQLTGGELDVSVLRLRETELLGEIGRLGSELSARRRNASRELERGVEAAIAELNMGGARFAVAIESRESADGAPSDGETVAFDETGIDRVEFMLASNAGEALKPLARTASGGEMARLMLALKSILAVADRTSTLVFDEVDVGVGGRSGQVVGEKLWGLARGHQVIVITHLPQIAAFAESHFRISKGERAGRTVSDVAQIDGEERIDEIAAMLDGVPVTPAARENARQMIERTNDLKSSISAAA